MINSEEIIYGTKIRNARQFQKFLARKKIWNRQQNQKRITAGTQYFEILVLASTRENGKTSFSTYTWNHLLLGNWGTYLSFQQGIIAT